MLLVLSGCAATPDVQDSDPAAGGYPGGSDEYNGQWRLVIKAKPVSMSFSGNDLTCGAINRVVYLYVHTGRVVNFASRDKPIVIGAKGKFKFDVSPARPIYRVTREGDSPRPDRRKDEWLRYQGKLEEGASGKYTMASRKFSGSGCKAKMSIFAPNNSAAKRPRRVSIPVASGDETRLLDFSAVNRNCKPADFKLVVLDQPEHGTVRVGPATDADSAKNRVRIRHGAAECRKVALDERQQVFYTPEPGYAGTDTLSVASITGDGMRIRVEAVQFSVGNSQ